MLRAWKQGVKTASSAASVGGSMRSDMARSGTPGTRHLQDHRRAMFRSIYTPTPPRHLAHFGGSRVYVNPRKSPDFAWAFASRLMFVLAYAFLVTYQAYYLLEKIGSTEAEVPQQIFLGTLAQSAVLIAAALIGGRLSDRTGRRKIFVFSASIVYGLALFMVAIATE